MSATAQLALDVRGFLAGMDLAKQGLNSLRNESGKVDEGNGMARLQVAAVALAATVAALGVAMYKGVTSSIELGARLVDVSYKSGLAIEQIMALERSLNEVGGKAEDAAPSTERFNQTLQQAANNAGPLVSILRNAGLSMESLAGMSVAQRMTAVGDAIRAIANPAQQAEAAVAAFGSSGIKMLAALDSKNLNSATAAMGSQAQIMQANAGVFARIMQLMGAQGSSLNSLAVAVKGKLQGLFTGIASGVDPTVLKIMEASSTGGMNLAAAIRQFSPALEPLATLVESLVKMDLAGVGAQLGAGAAAIAESIMNGDAIAYIKNGLSIAGVDFKAALLNAGTSISEAFTKLKDFLDVPGIIEQMRTGLQSAGNSLVGVIQKGMASMLQSLRNSSDFLQQAISPETVLALANQGAKTAKDASAALKGLFSGEGKDFSGMLGISQNEQVAADEAKKRNEEIEARSKRTVAKTGEDLRKQFATPAPGQQALTLPTAKIEQPIGGIFSSMAKIGGDIAGPQASAADFARQQLVAQQKTADNTAKMVDKLNKLQPASSAMASSYQ
jgi:hypothetical protein